MLLAASPDTIKPGAGREDRCVKATMERPAYPPLCTATDRCDACGHEAYVRVTLNVATLLFCAHHYRVNEDALALGGWHLTQDERERLTVKPSSGSA